VPFEDCFFASGRFERSHPYHLAPSSQSFDALTEIDPLSSYFLSDPQRVITNPRGRATRSRNRETRITQLRKGYGSVGDGMAYQRAAAQWE
jgi:hypothetical protein